MRCIRWGLAVIGVTACGRIGFGTRTADDAGGDSAVLDAALLAVPATPIAGFDAAGTTPASAFAIARTGAAVAIGWLGPLPSAVWGVAVDAAGVPATATPSQTTPVLGAGTPYRDLSIAYDGSHLLGMVSMPDETLYLKTFAPDMSGFFTADNQVGAVAVPAFAKAGSRWIGLYLTNGRPIAMPLGVDGRQLLPSTQLNDVGYVGATLASTGLRALAVLAPAGGTRADHRHASPGARDGRSRAARRRWHRLLRVLDRRWDPGRAAGRDRVHVREGHRRAGGAA